MVPGGHALYPVAQEIAESPQPLPGGVAAVVRFFFHVPQWIQIGGAVLAVAVAGYLGVVSWRRRREILRWLRTRSTWIQVTLGAVLVAIVTGAAVAGRVSWSYVQHENAFCTGCHVMGASYRKFTRSEHAELECHDCHQQPISASLRQVYLWVVERPEEIGPHAPVPDARCVECHITDRPDSVWQRISSTAGHRVHLESDSTALAEVMCVTCHGREVHSFVPADETCGQAECHTQEETDVVLGRMAAAQTSLHCLTCHQFTAPVGEEVARAEAAEGMTPRGQQCLGCHEMRPLLVDFSPERDPHAGVCGDCHDPHTQTTPRAAWETCTEAGCHARPEESTPFHRGLHDGIVADCEACHEAHHWTVEGRECQSCHRDVP